jgi:asparagine synthase (glutamine-hydrolysing)
MCGIFTLLNYEQKYSQEDIKLQFQKGKARGPENSVLHKVGHKITFGFHRLAINGLNDQSNQPLVKGDITLICNGEIYNFRELYELMRFNGGEVVPSTQSDCEVILWLYEKYGIEQTLQMIDGVFAFALLDQRHHLGEPALYIARDPYGVRPLYTITIGQTSGYYNGGYRHISETTVGFASELKMLSGFSKHCTAEHFTPGTYSKYIFSDKVCSEWAPALKNVNYHQSAFPCTVTAVHPLNKTKNIMNSIQSKLIRAVEKRLTTTERPIACLLSGGLDSSLIAALVNEYCKDIDPEYKLETYSIGLAESTDLKYARMVADYLGTNHTEIILTEQDFCNAIPEVIQAIESYDTTTVRASIGNYLLGKYIAANSQAKVIFNGDGSDELLGGYIYMKYAPDAIEFDRECRRLLKYIHAFDVLRSDKCISSHGLEPRTPFLDREWTQYYMSISPFLRYRPQSNEAEQNIEKYLLRTAFSPLYFLNLKGQSLLPEEVLWRRKEAFSDGVSGKERSLYKIIQEFCEKEVPLDVSTYCPKTDIEYAYTNVQKGYSSYIEMGKKHPLMTTVHTNFPKTAEQYYYRSIFETFYPGMGNIVPYFWMPRYVEANDASARTLNEYTQTYS